MAYKEREVEKIYYNIGEVADLLKVNQSKIRFWCDVFNLNIRVSQRKYRKFTNKDIDNLTFIKKLSDEKRYTLKGIEAELIKRKAVTKEEEPVNNDQVI